MTPYNPPFMSGFLWTDEPIRRDIMKMYLTLTQNFGSVGMPRPPEEDRLTFIVNNVLNPKGNLVGKTGEIYLEKNSPKKDKEFVEGQRSMLKDLPPPDYYLALKSSVETEYTRLDALELRDFLEGCKIYSIMMMNDVMWEPMVNTQHEMIKLKND